MSIFTKKEKNDDEKRRHKRHEIFQASYYKLHDDQQTIHDCVIHNLSLGGIMIETNGELPDGLDIVIIMNLNGTILQEKMRIIRKAKIITHRCGCNFIDRSTREKRERIISAYLKSL